MGPKYSWSRKEIYHLVEFIALHAERSVSESGWPKHKNSNFWEACAEYVAKMTRKDKRSHSSMRSKVTSYLAINFKNIEEAEEYFNIDYFSGNPSPDIHSESSPSVQVTTKSINNSSTSHNSFFDSCLSGFGYLPVDMQLKLLDSLFLKYARNLFSDKNILGKFSNDCLSTYMSAVINLHEKGKDNLIHHAARCFLKRDNGEETRLPIGKMPFGLFDYIVKFFSLPKSNRLSCEEDYEQWQVSMYANFGTKWAYLHRGPCWEYEIEDDLEVESIDSVPECVDVLSPDPVFDLSDLSNAVQGSQGTPEGGDILATALKMSSLSCLDGADAYSLPDSDTTSSTLWSPLPVSVVSHERSMGNDCQHVIANKYGLGKECRSSSSATRNPYIFDTMKAKVNVPGLSCRTLQNKIQKMDFEKSSVIQDAMLNKIAKENLGGRFWIKADGCDVSKGLRESMRHEWAGDTDIGDGALQRLNDIYNKRRDFCCKLGIGARKNVLTTDLGQLLAELDANLSFLDKGLTSSKKIYNDMVDKVSSSKESLFALAWDVEGFKQLIEINKNLQEKTNTVLGSLAESGHNNIPQQLAKLCDEQPSYLKNLFLKHRDAATHLLWFPVKRGTQSHMQFL